jgi:hypothetical protein
MGRKANPIFAIHRAKILETKPKMLNCNGHFETATKPRNQTNAKPRVPSPLAKKDTKAETSIAKLKRQTKS